MDRRTTKKLYPDNSHRGQSKALRAIALELYKAGMPAAKAAKYAPKLYALASVAAGDNAQKVAELLGGRLSEFGGHPAQVMGIFKAPEKFTETVRRALHSFADRHV